MNPSYSYSWLDCVFWLDTHQKGEPGFQVTLSDAPCKTRSRNSLQVQRLWELFPLLTRLNRRLIYKSFYQFFLEKKIHLTRDILPITLGVRGVVPLLVTELWNSSDFKKMEVIFLSCKLSLDMGRLRLICCLCRMLLCFWLLLEAKRIVWLPFTNHFIEYNLDIACPNIESTVLQEERKRKAIGDSNWLNSLLFKAFPTVQCFRSQSLVIQLPISVRQVGKFSFWLDI